MDLPQSGASLARVESQFQPCARLTVRQRRKWLEVLFSFELTNRYDVFGEANVPELVVEEQTGGVLGFFLRRLMGTARPFRAHVIDPANGQVLMLLRRPFRWIFHRLEVQAGDGTPIGAIVRRWSWLRRIYTIEDAQGRPSLEVFGPFFRPWTFELREGERQVGQIVKRWSGLGREIFTDADNFGIEMRDISKPWLRALCFAAMVLIDVVHFEQQK